MSFCLCGRHACTQYSMCGLTRLLCKAMMFLFDLFSYVRLTLSYFRTYIYVRNPKTVATPVRIYTYTDFAIEIWGFTGVYKTLYGITPRGVHVISVCCWQPFYSMFTNGRKVEFSRSCPLFLASFGKLRLSDQVQIIAWHGIQWGQAKR